VSSGRRRDWWAEGELDTEDRNLIADKEDSRQSTRFVGVVGVVSVVGVIGVVGVVGIECCGCCGVCKSCEFCKVSVSLSLSPSHPLLFSVESANDINHTRKTVAARISSPYPIHKLSSTAATTTGSLLLGISAALI
jgi:hypothetical protein